MTKEQIYDREIAPLMTQIIAIARREKIDFAASFELDQDGSEEDGPLLCSTVIVSENSPPNSSRLLTKIRTVIAESMKPAWGAFTILPGPALVTQAEPGHGDS